MTQFILLQETNKKPVEQTRVNVASIVSYNPSFDPSQGGNALVLFGSEKAILVRQTVEQIDALIRNRSTGQPAITEMIQSPYDGHGFSH